VLGGRLPKADASVLCWGSNSQGQLGMGSASSIPTLTPTIVPSLTNIVSLTAGNNTTCAITNQGAALCWGSNASGKLGDGTSTNRSTPTPVIGMSGGVSSIRTNNAHSCAIVSQSQLYCWGFNLFGQLGDASNTNRLTPTLVSGLGIGNVSSISTVENHTCAVANQASWCWGINDQGRLGDATTTNRNIPTAVIGQSSNMSSQPNAIATGNGHSCSLRQDGSATCWGLNTFGQLGDASTTSRNTPVPVQLTPPVTIPPLQVGYVHSDHLGSPRVITKATDNTKVWEWRNDDPFGNNDANENPSGSGSFEYNLRFPGQYRDKETATNYNWNRFYDSAIGRYTQSDPIGLLGGINTYAYVEGNPLNYTDPDGLQAQLNLFGASDPAFLSASIVPKGVANEVYGHGSPTGMWSGAIPGGRYLSPKELTDLLKRNPNYDPKLPTKLLGCNVGNGSYCQSVANSLGTTVQCYDETVWYWTEPKLLFWEQGVVNSWAKSAGKKDEPNYSKPGNLVTFTSKRKK
jgi:RHS repeat-associated protein